MSTWHVDEHIGVTRAELEEHLNTINAEGTNRIHQLIYNIHLGRPAGHRVGVWIIWEEDYDGGKGGEPATITAKGNI